MNQTVFITGTSSGIGAASVRRFAEAGWNVVAAMRDPKAAGKIVSQALVAPLDVADQDSIAAAVTLAQERFGRIDVLVNNAGYSQYGLFEAISCEKIQQQFDVNVFGVMDVTCAALPQMRAQGGGRSGPHRLRCLRCPHQRCRCPHDCRPQFGCRCRG